MNALHESEQLRSFFQTGQRRQYRKNELILRAGDEPRGVYLIESGLIKIYALTKNGDQHVSHFFGPGDFFPIIWLFTGTMRPAYYQALEPVTIWLVPKEEFIALVMHSQELVIEMFEEMVERYSRYSGRIENLLYSDARERCAYRLLSLGNRFGMTTKEGLVITANITHEDMARSLNMTRETFSRSLSRLQRQGIISYDDQHHIVIHDVNALAHTIGYDEARAQWPELIQIATE